MIAACDGSDPDPLALEAWCRATAPEGYYFDEDKAAKAVAFFPRYLVHTTGEWAGLPFHLIGWQKIVVRMLFGWRRPDGRRRFRELWLEIARKNGKSTFAAGLLILAFIGDGEAGAQVYSAAADRDQASIVFKDARRMAELSPALAAELEIYVLSMVCLSLGAVFKPISSKALRKHGLNPHAFCLDEVHAQATRELVDVLETAMGARRQPLKLYLTTPGEDVHSIEFEKHDRAEKVRDKVIADPELLPVIFAADVDDDWKSEATWRKANPSLGITVTLEDFRAEVQKAIETPGYENTFRRLKCCQRVGSARRHFRPQQWADNAGAIGWRELEDHLAGRDCYGALDLSATEDTTAEVLVFPPAADKLWHVLVRIFLPGDDLKIRIDKDRVPYDVWAREGALLLTDGNEVDQETIKRRLKADAEKFRIRECAFDRWNAVKIVQELIDDGLTMVPVGQGFGSMSAPSKELTKLVNQKRFRHGGQPVLAWQAANLVMKIDDAENMKPTKAKSTGRIDTIVAACMGINRAIALRDDDEPAPVEIPDGYEVMMA